MLVTGDIHGCIGKLERLLQREAIMNRKYDWLAEKSTLIFVGDYTDRGEDGIACIELIMHLENEAKKQGGQVFSLLGNHDILLLGAKKFGDEPIPNERPKGVGKSMLEQWQVNGGGKLSDLDRLQNRHRQWLEQRPAMLLFEQLFIHADTLNYLNYGTTVADVNSRIQRILESDNILDFDHLDEQFADRQAFLGKGGKTDAKRFLETYGGSRIIHGHTPIAKLTRQDPTRVKKALEYADGLCVNVDHGLYLGGDGFCFRT